MLEALITLHLASFIFRKIAQGTIWTEPGSQWVIEYYTTNAKTYSEWMTYGAP